MTVEQQNASAATAREKAQEKDKVNEGAVEEMRELEEGDPPPPLSERSGPADQLSY